VREEPKLLSVACRACGVHIKANPYKSRSASAHGAWPRITFEPSSLELTTVEPDVVLGGNRDAMENSIAPRSSKVVQGITDTEFAAARVKAADTRYEGCLSGTGSGSVPVASTCVVYVTIHTRSAVWSVRAGRLMVFRRVGWAASVDR
jgi:hypothetical protein